MVGVAAVPAACTALAVDVVAELAELDLSRNRGELALTPPSPQPSLYFMSAAVCVGGQAWALTIQTPGWRC